MDGWPDGGISMHEVAPINPWVALAYLASGILFAEQRLKKTAVGIEAGGV